MEAREKILLIEPSPWCEEAARYLAATLAGVPCFTVADYLLEIDAGAARLYRVTCEGELVGFFVLRVERYAGGAEGVILAAAGGLRGARLFDQVLPALERMFSGVSSIRVDTGRPGAIRQLLRAGYHATHVVMRKPVSPAAPRPVGDDLLEALDRAGACELAGPSIQARAGRLHKGSSSSSSTTQTTQQIDRRLVVDSGSVGVSSDTSTVNVSVLDAGAVEGALELVRASDQVTGKNVADVLGFAKDVFTAGLTVLDKAGRQIETQSELVAKAYDAARGEGTQKNMVTVAAVAAVAIVAVKVWGR
jgi:hypothetical protein